MCSSYKPIRKNTKKGSVMNGWKNLGVIRNPVFKPDGKRLKGKSHGSTYRIRCPDGDCDCNSVVFEQSGCKT